MPEDTSLMLDLAAWAALVAGFTAYTVNVQRTTLDLGRRIATSPETAVHMQTVITPSWQTRSNVIMYILNAIYLGVCFFALTWYLAILAFLGTLLIAVPLISFAIPRPMSQFIASRIYRALEKRGAAYEQVGDSARALACQDAIELLNTRGNVSAASSQPAASGTSSESALLEAQEHVKKYGAVLEHSKTVTRSEAVLPATKEQIKDALVALARHARASGASPETLELLRVGYASLADFVSERDAEAANTFDSLATAGAAELGRLSGRRRPVPRS